MDNLLAITILCIVFAIGDFISAKTRSIVSMMFVSSVILLISFWIGLPKSIFEDSQMLNFGILMIGFLITHMGTLMSFEDLKSQWKTVLISISAVVGIGVFVFLLASPIIGREYAVSAAPPISGGVVAAIIMGDAASAKGLESIAVFATIIVVVQGFFGYPIASFLLNKEAKKIMKDYRRNRSKDTGDRENIARSNINKKKKKRLIPELPEHLQTNFILLAKLSLFTLIAFFLSSLTNEIVHKYVMCLFVGIIGRESGFLEENIMVKSNSLGIGMVGLMSVIFSSLTKATPQMLSSLFLPLIVSIFFGLVGIILTSSIVGKLLGYSISMSVSIGVSALFGFPGTFVLPNEVASANANNPEEKQVILDEILPKMLVAGFITVTIASVVLAGFMVKLV